MTKTRGLSKQFLLSDTALLCYIALCTLILHWFSNAMGGYGFFRDELYYIACTDHPDLGYVDQPPLSIYVLAVSRWLFGDSLFAIRLIPALAGAAMVVITGFTARAMGGGRPAQLMAAMAMACAPINLGFDNYFSMNSLDILFWTWGAYVVVRLVNTEDPRYWLLLGCVLGAGLLNKISVLWFGSGLAAGFLLTSHRHWFKTRWPWYALGISVVLFLPYVVWNMMHDFAHLEFIRNAVASKYSSLTAAEFIKGQALLENPIALPLWLAGAGFFFFTARGKPYRLLGIAYVVAFLILMVNGHSKAEYLAAAYGFMFAGGGIMVEPLFVPGIKRRLMQVYAVVLVATAIVLAPFALPILPVESYIRYAGALGLAPSSSEAKKLDRLPQSYADMFGWEEKAAAVARAYHALSPEEQKVCAVFADNYGRCGAIDFFGKNFGLPKSIGKHNSYWIWGPRNYTGEVMIILGGALKDKQDMFGSVEVAETVSNTYCMPYENNLNVYVCRKLKVPLKELWPRMKQYS